MLWFSGKNFWSKSNGAEREERRKELTPPFMRHWWIPGSSLTSLTHSSPSVTLSRVPWRDKEAERQGAGIERERERGREGKRERIQYTQLRISEVSIQSTSINQSYNPSQRCSSLYSTVYFSFILKLGSVWVRVFFPFFFLVVSRSELSVCFFESPPPPFVIGTWTCHLLLL